MKLQSTLAPEAELPLTDRVRGWREQILSRVFLSALIFGGIQLLVEVWNWVTRGTPNPMFGVFLLIYAGLAVLALNRRIPFAARAWTMVLTIYLLAVLDLVRYSRLAEGHLYLFLMISLAVVLFDHWRTVAVSVAAVGTLAAVAAGSVLGILPLNAAPSGWLSNPGGWLTNLAAFLAIAMVQTMAVLFLVKRLNQSLAAAEEARDGLREANRLLERRVAERTAQLEQALADATAARLVAEEASEMKTRFLANMSHELRTPLNAIINFSYMIAQGLHGPVNERQQSYLGRVQASGEHLLHLINDILDLAKIEAGRLDLFPEPVQVAPLIQGALATAVGLTRDKPIELVSAVAPDLPEVEADPTRLRQILLNLLSNAAKFTHEGSITVAAVARDGELIISVADTGIGIPADQQALIFEEFRQVDGGASRSYEGTGLGLAICRRLITMHGGRIWVESVPGAGSTFSVSLPLAGRAQEQPAPVSAPAAGPTGEAPTVLVVDDDPLASEIVGSYLRAGGYAVVAVADSREALAAARAHRPAAIILDILMPHRDGWQVLADLKADPELHAIPVALYTIIEETRRGYHLGASAYLVKPVAPAVLLDTIGGLVARPGRLLVIDDDPSAREIAVELLGGQGYQVATAPDGAAGLTAIAAEPPDLVILDLMMPGLDGFAVLAELGRRPETRRIPVVVVTAKELTSAERTYLRERVVGLVRKGDEVADQLAGWVARGLSPTPAA